MGQIVPTNTESIAPAAIGMSALAVVAFKTRACSELQQYADSVEKQRVAFAESCALKSARAPFLSGFARLLRCRKNLSQFAEVLGGGGEEEFVICTAWAA